MGAVLTRLKRIAFIFLVFFLVSCGVEHKPPLRVGINLWPGYEPFFLARDMGEYKELPISLIEYPSPSGAIRAMRNGTVEAVALTLDEVLSLIESGVKAKVVLVINISDGGDAILTRPDILSLEQLRGKAVVSESSVLANYLLSRALDETDLGLSDIERLYLPISEHLQAYERNQADAIVTFEPVRTKLINAGARELFSSAQIPGEIVDVLIVRDDVIEAEPEVVQALVDGWYNALQQLHKYPDKTAEKLSEHLQITPEEVLSSFSRLNWPGRSRVSEMLNENNAAIEPMAKRIQHIMLKQQQLGHEYAFKSLFTDRFVK